MEWTTATVIGVLTALPTFFRLIIEMMTAIQDEFGKGKGAEKKEIVLNGIQNIITDESVWTKVRGVFSSFIDVWALFKKKDPPAK